MPLIFLPRNLVVDVNGVPRVGAKLYVYDAGTTTPRVTYPTAADAEAETNSQTHPLASNSSGQFAPAYIREVEGDYKILLTDADDVPLSGYPVDNIPVLPFDQDLIGQTLYPRTAAEIAAGVTPVDYSYPPHNALRYGADPTGGVDSTIALQRMIDSTPDYGEMTIPPGLYALTATAEGPDDWATEDGDSAIDASSSTALAFRERTGLTIKAAGARFDSDDEYSVTFYKCVDCRWLGGRFEGEDAYLTSLAQPAAVLVARCLNVWIEDSWANKFYRNFEILRSSWSGALRCRSTNAGYFCFYAAGSLDIALTGEPSVTSEASWSRFDKCIARAGKYGNFLLMRAGAINCQSNDCGRQGVAAAHFSTDNGPMLALYNTIYESSNQNTGDIVDGISLSAGTSYIAGGTAAVIGSRLIGNTIIGCRKSIEIIHAEHTVVSHNHCRDYYLGGIQAYSRDIGGTSAFPTDLVISHNTVGAFNSASTLTPATYSPKAAIAVEANDALPIRGAVVDGNIINCDRAGAVTVTSTVYELACNDPAVEIRNNVIRGTKTQQRTGAFKIVSFTRDISTASGTQAVTGVGFKPSAVILLAATNGQTYASVGFNVGAGNNVSLLSNHGVSADTFSQDGTSCITINVNGSDQYAGVLSSLDTDGFTVTWTKTGTPTGTVTIRALCIR